MTLELPPNVSEQDPVTLREKQIEQQRMHEVQLLFDTLLRREEVILKLIINRLYEVGATNLINQRVQTRSLNGLAKYIARFSKPAFRCVALYWVKKNCPRLVTNWLHNKVSFKSQTPPQKDIVDVVDETLDPVFDDSESDAEQPAKEVQVVSPDESALVSVLPPATSAELQVLRTQVRWLAGTTIAAIAALGGTITYISYRLEINPLQLLYLPEAVTVKQSGVCRQPCQTEPSTHTALQKSTLPTTSANPNSSAALKEPDR